MVNCQIYGKFKFYYIFRNPELGSSRDKVQVTYFSGTNNKTLIVMKKKKEKFKKLWELHSNSWRRHNRTGDHTSFGLCEI